MLPEDNVYPFTQAQDEKTSKTATVQMLQDSTDLVRLSAA